MEGVVAMQITPKSVRFFFFRVEKKGERWGREGMTLTLAHLISFPTLSREDIGVHEGHPRFQYEADWTARGYKQTVLRNENRDTKKQE